MRFWQLVLLGLSGVICTSLPTGFFSLTKYIVLRVNLPSFDHDVARIVLEDLTAAGILQGNVDEMMSVNLGGRWDLHQNLSIRI